MLAKIQFRAKFLNKPMKIRFTSSGPYNGELYAIFARNCVAS